MLRRVLKAYADYYNNDRTHLALNKDTQNGRAVGSEGGIISRQFSQDCIIAIGEFYLDKVFGRDSFINTVIDIGYSFVAPVAASTPNGITLKMDGSFVPSHAAAFSE